MRITDLLDTYPETEIDLPEAETPAAERTKELVRGKLESGKRRPRLHMGVLIAACIAVLCCVTAGAAYYVGHQRTIDLMETGPWTGGNTPAELDDASKSVIERTSRDYGLTVQDGDATLTLDSSMGYSSKNFSALYLTLTMTPPAETEFTAGAEDLGFWVQDLELSGDPVSCSGSTTAVAGGDGTVSVMLMYCYQGDIQGRSLTLKLQDFGNVSKEAARELFDGSRQIEAPGTWEFTIDGLDLEEARILNPDSTDFSEIGFVPSEIAISSFGGMVTISGSEGKSLKALAEPVAALHPEMDWDAMTAEQLNLLMAEGNAFTDEETEMLSEIFSTLSAQEEQGLGALESLQVRYPDGSVYDAGIDVWMGSDEEGNILHAFRFDAPQDLDSAESIVINGVEIPLQ